MDKTLLFIQRLLQESVGIPFSRVPLDKAELLHFLRNKTEHVLDDYLSEATALWQQLLQIPVQNSAIYQWRAPGEISFLVYAEEAGGYFYVFGPVLTEPFSQDTCLQTLSPYDMPQQAQESVLNLCKGLAVVQEQTLYRISNLVIGYLLDGFAPMQAISVTMPVPEKHLIANGFSGEENVAHMRNIEDRYEYSAALTDAVRQGNLSLALHMVGQYDPGTQTPMRNANPLRNAQNYCIVLNTQLRHALEKSGIHPYQVDKLSNAVGMEIELLKNVKQIPHCFRDVLTRYCRLVQEHSYPNLNPLTNLAVTYIKEHLSDNLTVKDTAKILTVNANYLSALFHRDMGMTFIDFVNKERTRQAAALLKHTNLQIQQIASLVGYNNTSYFAKQFVRFQKVPPSQYRHN